ncbi:Polysaccharide monooxygenase Cel61a [Colletotrichum shisoi]|uniref:lytic cellulose monooxygenase (C4-dehydrogenating) n=1 Tax=Colletotrichum shisoi TaxID=2078593 RepID=A0A5Q4C6E8_9PEZI|nr:Polysaccharide monooxygenase Cel61a [Colletotrichum shisoi]
MKYTIASLLGSAALVAAHGYVDTGLIGGENYTFYQPYQDSYANPAPDRISRPIQGNGPVEDVTSIDIQCGGYTAGGFKGSSPAKLVAKVAAGEEVILKWTLWPDSHIGPTITYMAKCPSDDCTSWQPGTEAVWFKVQEAGREGTSKTWATTPLMKAGNPGVKYTIPECIAPGQYLVRHEIIALHSAYAYPGVQFYPGCHQLEVTGSGSTSPSDLVAFPGAYKAADPGITYDAYSKAVEYPIPGPALFSCSGSGSGSAPAPPAAPSAAPTSTAAPAATSAPATSVASAATPSQTAAAEDDEEEDCPAEVPSASVSAAAAAPTLSAEEDDEYDCPAESEAPAATTTAAPVATPTQPADEEEDDCPAESEAPAAEDEEDDCPAETPYATPVAKRMAFHERRSHKF